MHTKPISTEVIASSEATSTRGFASLIIEEADTGSCDSKPKEMFAFDWEDTSERLTNFQNDLLAALNKQEPIDETNFLKMIKGLKSEGMGETKKFDDDVHFVVQAVVSYPYMLKKFDVTKDMANTLKHQMMKHLTSCGDVKNELMQYFEAMDKKYEVSATAEFKELTKNFKHQLRPDDISEMRPNQAQTDAENEVTRRLGPIDVEYAMDSSERKIVEEADLMFKKLTNDSLHEYVKFTDLSQLLSNLSTTASEHGTWEEFIDNLPVLSIIAMMNQPKEERKMNDAEKTNLFLDISAVEYFYRELHFFELKDGEAPSEVEDVLRFRLEYFKSDMALAARPIYVSDLAARPIFTILLHYHNIDTYWKAISACSDPQAETECYTAHTDTLTKLRVLFGEGVVDVKLLEAIGKFSDPEFSAHASEHYEEEVDDFRFRCMGDHWIKVGRVSTGEDSKSDGF